MRKWLPQTILGQVVAIVVSALVITISATIVFFATFGPLFPPRPAGPGENVLAIAVAVHALEAVPAAERARVAAALSSDSFRVPRRDRRGPAPAMPTAIGRSSDCCRRCSTTPRV